MQCDTLPSTQTMGAQTGEKINQSASVASDWTWLVYMPSNSNREGCAMRYTIYVGGVEVSDYYLTKTIAEHVANNWRDMGYDDVYVVEVEQ